MTDTLPAPYPADTRAKGWRFELDLERIEQSDTWALAAPDVRPWLFLLWAKAWQQAPCGSLPNDDALIAARIGMAPKAFSKARAVLLRGWWVADDGRLYHDVIAARVMAMLESKRKESDRKAAYRSKMDAERSKTAATVLQMSHGTTTGQTVDGRGCDDTGTSTGTRTSTGLKERESTHLVFEDSARATPGDLEDFSPTPAGAICRSLRTAGIANTNPGHPMLGALLEAGATEAEFVGAVAEAATKRDPFAYLLSVVKGQREEAAKAVQGLHKGPLHQAAPTETAYARKMREQYELMAPSIAARKPGGFPTPRRSR